MSSIAILNMISIITIVVGGFIFFARKASQKEQEKRDLK